MAAVDRSEYSTTRFWDHLVQRGASAAIESIRDLMHSGELSDDALALAHGAAGRCLFEAGRIDEALAEAGEAFTVAEDADEEVRLWVTMGASYVLAEAGRIDEALARLWALVPETNGVELGRLHVQLATILHHAGRLNESLTEFDVGQRLLADAGHAAEQVRVHNNRGVVLLQQGRFAEADDDFSAAERIAAATELWSAQAQSVANRAVLLGRSRRLPEAVAEFDRAAEIFETSGNPARLVAIMSIDQAEVMMHSGLLSDAVDAGHEAIASVEKTGNSVLLGDAQLVTARAELAARRYRAATGTAELAARTFLESDRSDMVAHARSVALCAALEGARSDGDVVAPLSEAVSVVDELRRAGWDDAADAQMVVRIRVGRRWGLDEHVRADVEALRSGAVDGRRDTALVGWWAEAVAQVMFGDAEAASTACHEGLGILDDIVAEAPSLESRSAAMRMGSDLSELLIEIAIEQADADTVLAAAEGTRARALHDELATGERHRPLTVDGADRLRQELVARLGDRTLVEWVVARDRVHAVVFGADGSRLVDVGDRSSIARACDRVMMWLDIAPTEPDGSSERARRATRQLDDLLVAPLGLPPDVGVVMVPVDLLHRIPWSGLPSFAGRPVVMAPTAQTWLEADRRSAGAASSVGLVIGPELEADAVERAAIEASYPGAVVASGAGATGATLRSMLGGSDVVQIAAHGSFRSDHPLLSTLQLDDGEATLHDAIPERVRSKLVVLSSCEGGAQGTADGSEVLGMSAVLLARGASTVVAPLTAVRDLECAEFVVEVHRELVAGESVACALANVRARWLADDDLSRWAVASSFACFGSGAVRVTV